MKTARHPEDLRLAELLADEACADLEPADRTELEQLLAGRKAAGPRTEYVRAASLAQVAFAGRDGRGLEPMPAHLRRRLADQAAGFLARPQAASQGPAPVDEIAKARARRAAVAPAPLDPPRRSFLATAGWAVAATVVLAVLVTGRIGGPSTTGDGTPGPSRASTASSAGQARSALLASAPDAVTLPWQPPMAAGFEGVTGDVVWSDARQQGYLRLAGLPANDPARAQYQLWIVDPDRDAHPVDGGVFNVSARGEVIIPVQARLPVAHPKAFAITLEKPGGVVVSAGPLLVVAQT